MTPALTWLKYCLYGVKLYPINQLINQIDRDSIFFYNFFTRGNKYAAL